MIFSWFLMEFYELVVAMVTHEVFSWKIASKCLFTFLAQCQHLERFPQNAHKKLYSKNVDSWPFLTLIFPFWLIS